MAKNVVTIQVKPDYAHAIKSIDLLIGHERRNEAHHEHMATVSRERIKNLLELKDEMKQVDDEP